MSGFKHWWNFKLHRSEVVTKRGLPSKVWWLGDSKLPLQGVWVQSPGQRTKIPACHIAWPIKKKKTKQIVTKRSISIANHLLWNILHEQRVKIWLLWETRKVYEKINMLCDFHTKAWAQLFSIARYWAFIYVSSYLGTYPYHPSLKTPPFCFHFCSWIYDNIVVAFPT